MATIEVTTLDDVVGVDGQVSLREAIAAANSNLPVNEAASGTVGYDFIVFAPSLSGVIRLSLGTLVVTENVYITGGLDANGEISITLSGDVGDNDAVVAGTDISIYNAATFADNVQVLRATGAGTGLILSNLVITGGNSSTTGGGIFVQDSISATNVEISGNAAANGGGLYSAGYIGLLNASVSGNSASSNGGGLYSELGVVLTNTTLSGNSAALKGGGAYTQGANLPAVTLGSSTVTGNSAADGGGIYADRLTFTNSVVLGNTAIANAEFGGAGPLLTGGNILGGGAATAASVFASLDTNGGGHLASNGGAVRTVALNASIFNPAIDAAGGGAATSDARGFARFDNGTIANALGTAADLGAFEVQNVRPVVNFDWIDLVALAAVGDVAFQTIPGTDSGIISASTAIQIGLPGSTINAGALGDVNNDGRLDYVALEFPSGSSWYRSVIGNGNGGFSSILTGASIPEGTPSDLTLADMNGDGNLDLVYSNSVSSTVSIRLGVGNGQFASPTSTASGSHAVAVGDLDGDGNLDVVSAGFATATVSVLFGNGDGTVDPAISLPALGQMSDIALADLDGDGNLDIVATSQQASQVLVYLNQGAGTFASAVGYDTGNFMGEGNNPVAVTIGDIDGDGILDLVTAGAGAITQFKGNGDGSFQQGLGTYNVGTSPEALVLYDADGDGDLDLAVGNLSSGAEGVVLIYNNGAGSFTHPQIITTTFGIGDLDAGQLSLVQARTLAFSESDSLGRLFGGLSITDPDNQVLAGATVTIGGGFSGSGDSLSVLRTVAGISTSFDATTGILTLLGSASLADYERLLKSVIFTSGDNPTNFGANPARTLSLVVNDGTGLSDPATVTVNVTAINDAPTVVAPGSIAVVEDQASPLTAISFADPDAGSGAVAVAFSVTAGQGTLAATSGSGVTVLPGGSAISLLGTIADINAFIAAGKLTFTTAANANGAVTLGIAIDDLGSSGAGSALTATGSTSLDIAQINDAPVLAGDLAATVSEGSSTVLTTADLNFTDPDDSAAGVSFTVSNPVRGSILVNGAAATSFTGTQLAAGQVSFLHDGSETLTASFSVLVEDGNEDASVPVAQVFNLAVTPVNDAPLLAGDLAATVLEGGAIVITAADLNFTDADDAASGVSFAVSGAAQGSVLVNGVAAASFTGAQLAAGQVSFLHDGSETLTASFAVAVDDGNEDASAPVAQVFNLAVTPVNDPATLRLTQSLTHLAENASTSVARKVADLTVTDVDGGANRLSLTGADAKLFEINGSSLFLKAGTKLDFETNSKLDVRVVLDDHTIAGIEDSVAVRVAITDVIESLVGTPRIDRLLGTNHAESIRGLAGNDRIYGRGGNDIIDGGRGADILSGGVGSDTFRYTSIRDSGIQFGDAMSREDIVALRMGNDKRDLITDFTHGQDKLDLRAIDADTTQAGNQAFVFKGKVAFTDTAGELIYRTYNLPGQANDMTLVLGDTNGDGLSDFQIELSGLKLLSSTDFVL